MPRLGSNIILAFLVFAVLGCELRRANKPSVLVIAVEGLGFDSVSCDVDEPEDQAQEGMRVFCQEAVRFSHAYSPSPLSQASVASLVTGLYPFDHGVHHNGSDFLSAKFQTLAEGALSRGYRTLFVSGGVPIWRKSGLAQGFEIFDDTMDLSPGVYYRPGEEVVKLATNWLEQLEGQPFLAVLFLSDLQFPLVSTRSNDGEVRENSREGQLAEIGESVGTLIKWLKTHKRWNSTHVVLTGVNSLFRRETEMEPRSLSLRSTSVQVTLFIKPARKEQDNVIQWAVDRNVSLVDVGRTMFNWIGLESPKSSIPELEVETLNSALIHSEPDWSAGRLIASETAWPDWLEGSGLRWALRQNQFLYIYDSHPLIFNTLTDRMESLPLKPSDPLWNSLNSQVVGLLNRTRVPPWAGMQKHWLTQIEVARELWRGNLPLRHARGNEPWSKWYMHRALNQGDWLEVKRLARESADPIAQFTAARHLNESMPIPRQACVRLLLSAKGDKNVMRSECEDEQLLALHAWQTAGEEERAMAQERFMRLYQTHFMDRQIGRMNFLNDLRWDVDRNLPQAPSALDFLLTLKEFEPLAKKVSTLFSGKDMAL